MKRHSWTFLYVPAGDGGVRTVHVDKRLVGIVGGSVLAFTAVVVLLCVSYFRQNVVVNDVVQRDAEIAALRTEIAGLEDKVQHFEFEMAQNLQLQERANLLAGLGPLDSSAREGGVGGHEPYLESMAQGRDQVSRTRAANLRQQLDQLLGQAQFQRAGYEQVLRVLQEDQRLRETTPSIRPLRGGYLSSRYGRRIDPFTSELAFHRGLDFSAPKGTPVFATAAGTVKRASRHGSLGNLIEIDHGNGIVTRYGHLQEMSVRKSKQVDRGDIIGTVGNTGRSTASHLHYEVVRSGRSENPWLYIIRD